MGCAVSQPTLVLVCSPQNNAVAAGAADAGHLQPRFLKSFRGGVFFNPLFPRIPNLQHSLLLAALLPNKNSIESPSWTPSSEPKPDLLSTSGVR